MNTDNNRLTRLTLGYLTDLCAGTLTCNLPMYLSIYSDVERTIAYRFLVRYAPTFRVFMPTFKSGQITQSQMFDAIYRLMVPFSALA